MLPSCGITSFPSLCNHRNERHLLTSRATKNSAHFTASDTTALKVSLAMADPNFSLRWNVKPKGCLTLRLENLPAWSVVVFVPSVEHFSGCINFIFLSIDFSIFPGLLLPEMTMTVPQMWLLRKKKSWLFLVRFFYSLKREELTFQWKIVFRKWVSNLFKVFYLILMEKKI